MATYSAVWLPALRLGKLVDTLGLMASNALDLDEVATNTLDALDLVSCIHALVFDCHASIAKLFLREGRLVEKFVASLTFEPARSLALHDSGCSS